MRKPCSKAMGRPRKPLAEVYSQVRPVARHFVWGWCCTLHANRNPMKIQTLTREETVGISTTLERFTSERGILTEAAHKNFAGGVGRPTNPPA
jgi:hypothetical protein